MNLEHVTEFGISKTPQAEFDRRMARMWKEVEEQHLAAMVFFSCDAVTYLTGSPLIPTERPMAFVCTPEGEQAMLVPRLEYEHAQMHLPGCHIACYPEYPGERHPMLFLVDLLKEMGLEGKTLGVDSDGYPPVYGYSGPSLSSVLGRDDLKFFPRLVQKLKVHKSEYELSLIRESSRWSTYALSLLQDYTKPGLREFDVSFQAGLDGAQAMLKTLGKRYQPNSLSDCGVWVGYRGQIGVHSYYPHAVTTNAMFHKGDLLGWESPLTCSGSTMTSPWSCSRPLWRPSGPATAAATWTGRCGDSMPSTAWRTPGGTTPATAWAPVCTSARCWMWGMRPSLSRACASLWSLDCM